jgi:hypothetical protein
MPAMANKDTSTINRNTITKAVVELYQGITTFLKTGFLSAGMDLFLSG